MHTCSPVKKVRQIIASIEGGRYDNTLFLSSAQRAMLVVCASVVVVGLSELATADLEPVNPRKKPERCGNSKL